MSAEQTIKESFRALTAGVNGLESFLDEIKRTEFKEATPQDLEQINKMYQEFEPVNKLKEAKQKLSQLAKKRFNHKHDL
tara:strand:+ start:156 stop:392 length:237 start_codon:yes stop_codon:yes gene_type:complete